MIITVIWGGQPYQIHTPDGARAGDIVAELRRRILIADPGLALAQEPAGILLDDNAAVFPGSTFTLRHRT